MHARTRTRRLEAACAGSPPFTWKRESMAEALMPSGNVAFMMPPVPMAKASTDYNAYLNTTCCVMTPKWATE